MTQREALLAAIREQPDEDTPRLAYADLLDELGADQRNQYFLDWAALIRTQIDFARTERFSDRWFELAARQAELFEKRKQDWSEISGTRLGQASYRRGFREAIPFYADAEGFERHLDLAFAGNPLRVVRLMWYKKPEKAALAAVARHPGMGRVETFDVGNTGSRTAIRLLEAIVPRAPRLRALGVGSLRLSATTAAELLARLDVRGLCAIDLHENLLFGASPMAEYRPERLFHSPVLAGVRWLDLDHTGLTATAVSALAHSPVLKGVRHLNLGTGPTGAGEGTTFGPEGAEALAAGPAVRGVEYLSLVGQRIGADGTAALARSPLLSTVRELDLQGNDLGDDGVASLAACPHLGALRKLNLDGNAIGTAGAEALLASPHLAGLRVLTLYPEYAPPHPDVWRRLAERFPNREPAMPGDHGTAFFDPIP
jgi:uncharacterized protein (TIGR02996 family)